MGSGEDGVHGRAQVQRFEDIVEMTLPLRLSTLDLNFS